MNIEFSAIAQTVQDYLLWEWECDSKGWEEYSKGKCRAMPLIEAIEIYREEMDYWLSWLIDQEIT